MHETFRCQKWLTEAMGNLCCCVQVDQSTVAIREQFGKFDSVLEPGCHCLPWFIGKRVAGHLTLRLQQLDVRCETKTKVRPKHCRDKWMHSCFLFTLLEYGGMAIILFQHKFQGMKLIIFMFFLCYKACEKRYQSNIIHCSSLPGQVVKQTICCWELLYFVDMISSFIF